MENKGIKLHPSKPGIYVVRYAKVDKSTKRRVDLTRHARSLPEARRIHRRLIEEASKRLYEQRVPKWQEVLSIAEAAFREMGKTEGTIDDYLTCLRAHTLEAWGKRNVDTVTGAEIKALIADKLKDRSQGHQKSVLKMIRAAFQVAVEQGFIKQNPTPRLAFRVGDKIKGTLTEEQVRLLLHKAKEYNHDWYAHWCMAIYTGCRSGELYALTWDKVCLEKRQILINQSWNNKDGFKCTKSGDDRIVGIAGALMTVLAELRLQSGPSNFVLPRLNEWTMGRQAEVLRMFLQGIGLPQMRFHDLRASWATILLSRGVEPIKVMTMGGWKDMKTMMIYIRKAGVDIRGATDCLQLHNPSSESARVIQILG